MVSVISFCLKTHPGFRVEMIPALNNDLINGSLRQYTRNSYAYASSTAMPKTTTFRYVSSSSSKSSGSSFSPTSTDSPLSSTIATPTANSYQPQYIPNERSDRLNAKHVQYNCERSYSTVDVYESQPHEAFFYVELLCNIWFIVEFTTRFLVIIHKYLLWLWAIKVIYSLVKTVWHSLTHKELNANEIPVYLCC